jgi:preprotein translocase subunit SecG
MRLFLESIELIIAILLIGAVLLHAAKGEGLGGIGGQARIFRSTKGLETGLNQVTSILAGLFLVIAGILSVFF